MAADERAIGGRGVRVVLFRERATARYAALAACALTPVLALAGCGSDPDPKPASLDRPGLEARVAGMITPDDPDATVRARCDGAIAVKVGARRDCHLTVGREAADVHVRVVSVDGRTPRLEVTPYIPPDRLGEAIRSSLSGQGYRVDAVECDEELLGEADRSASCVATPAEGQGHVEVHVTKVDGLMVNFDYEVLR